jgi:DNA-binding NarL/FixJ family response regulator
MSESFASDQPIKRARVVLADDHARVTEALKRILSSEFDVVGTVGDGLALLRAVAELAPDIIVVDVSMPKLDGFSALERLRTEGSDVKVILVSGFYEPSFVNIALEWGASGFVAKYSAYNELIPAVHAALEGKIYRSPCLDNKPANSRAAGQQK